MLVNYMITRCDHIAHVGKETVLSFGLITGGFAALPYKLITLSLICTLFSFLFIKLSKAYKAYQLELEKLPEQTQSRVKSAIKKHHHNQLWWRWPTTAVTLSVISFFIIELIILSKTFFLN